MTEASAHNIGPEHFIGKAIGSEPATAPVWEWMMRHYRRYRNVPSIDIFKTMWPGFQILSLSDTMPAVVDHFVRTVKRRVLINAIRGDLAEIADDWERVGDAEVHVLETARALSRLVPTTSATRYSESLTRLELYKLREQLGTLPGISFGLQEFDDLTYGIQNYETVIIEGFLNIGKSTMGVNMAARNYFLEGGTPLFISLEMEGDALAKKWDAMAAQISYRAIKRMELGEGDLARWEQIAEAAADARFERDIIVIDDIHRCTVDRIFTEIERWQPSVTFVDTIDEIRAPSHLRSVWEQQAYAARELKGISRSAKRPIVGMAQAGRDAEQQGATLGNIAGSIDIARKADIVIGLHATPQMQQQKKMEVRALKIRDDEGKGSSYDYFWDVAHMSFRRWKPSDAMIAPPAAV